MTIAACLPCKGGVVFGADTDETFGAMRRRVYKIPGLCDGSAFITGACENGNLMDTTVERIFRKLTADKPTKSRDVDGILRDVMLRLYREDFQAFPSEESNLQLLVGVRARDENRVETWSIDRSAVHRLNRARVVGYGEYVDFIVDQLYQPGIPLDNGIVIMIQLLALAKRRVNFVGGDLCIAVQKDEGGYALENIRFAPEQEELYESFIGFGRQLLLATALKQTTDEQYDKLIADFGRNMKWLRQRISQSSSAKFRESLLQMSSTPSNF